MRSTTRAVRFDYPDDFDPRWNRHRPELAAAANSVSLLMPHAEPYVARAVRATLADLDGELAERARTWVDQELKHHTQHRAFNERIAAHHPAVARLDRWMRRTYGRLGRRRSLRFSLGFAAGFETVAFATARWVDDHLGEFFADADPVPATLFLWHLAEEVEHKSVAFDVHRARGGSRWTYLAGMSVSFALMAWFTTIGTVIQLAGQRRLLHPVAWFRLLRWSFSLLFEVVPIMVVTLLPGHHPDDLADPAWVTGWLADLDRSLAAGREPEPLAFGAAA